MEHVHRTSVLASKRPKWKGKLGYLEWMMTCMAFLLNPTMILVGPHKMYFHGGVYYLIPYLLSWIILGIPLMILEMSLGQFTGIGVLTCWNFAPIAIGLGISIVLYNLYYAVIIGHQVSYSVFYLFASMLSEPPWTKCGQWASNLCSERNGTLWKANCTTNYNHSTDTYITQCTRSSVIDYFYKNIGDFDASSVIPHGSIDARWCLSSLAFIVMLYLVLIRGIRSLGKVCCVVVVIIFLCTMMLLVKGLTLEGSSDGLRYLFTPHIKRLQEPQVLASCVVHVLFTDISLGFGSYITLSSYNRFHNDFVRDTLLLFVGRTIISILLSIMVFCFVGFLSLSNGQSVYELSTGGISLSNALMPDVFTHLSGKVWPILFHSLMVLLHFGSMAVLVETIVTAICDLKEKLRKYSLLIRAAVCTLIFILSLPLQTKNGRTISIMAGWVLFLTVTIPIVILQYCLVCYSYGARQLIKDIDVMLGSTFCFCICIPWRFVKRILMILWIASNVVLLFVLIAVIIQEYQFSDDKPPIWDAVVGMILATVYLPVLFGALYRYVTATGPRNHRLHKLFHKPTRDFGPRKIENRPAVQVHRLNLVVDNSVDPVQATSMASSDRQRNVKTET